MKPNVVWGVGERVGECESYVCWEYVVDGGHYVSVYLKVHYCFCKKMDGEEENDSNREMK